MLEIKIQIFSGTHFGFYGYPY